MVIELKDIKEIFNKLLNAEICRKEASEKAIIYFNKESESSLIYKDRRNEEVIWESIEFLYGVDDKVSPNEYFYTILDIKNYYNKYFS